MAKRWNLEKAVGTILKQEKMYGNKIPFTMEKLVRIAKELNRS